MRNLNKSNSISSKPSKSSKLIVLAISVLLVLISIAYLLHLVVVIMFIVSVSVVTLLERKSLLSVALNSVLSMLQPLADGLKLLSKCCSSLVAVNRYLYVLSSIIVLLLMLGLVAIAHDLSCSHVYVVSLVGVVVLVGCSVYVMLVIR